MMMTMPKEVHIVSGEVKHYKVCTRHLNEFSVLTPRMCNMGLKHNVIF